MRSIFISKRGQSSNRTIALRAQKLDLSEQVYLAFSRLRFDYFIIYDLSLLGEVTLSVDWSDVLNFDQAGLSHRKIEDNILFALHNSSHPTQPHSVIANYDNDHFVDQRPDFKLLFVHLEMSLLDSTQGFKRVNSRQINSLNIKTIQVFTEI